MMKVCSRCGEERDAEGEKYESIERLLGSAVSWKRIEAEIAKCEVRCANCHRIKTLERGRWWRSELVQ